jgi:hypothetical protein
MLRISFGVSKREQAMNLGPRVFLVVAYAALALPLAAQQQQGPLPPPPPGTVISSGAPADPAKANSVPQETSSHITNEPPAVPVEQIIQKFTQHEDEFRKERENYTYTQFIMFQTIDSDGQVDGEYRMTSDILFTPAGKRYEKVLEAPASSIQRITMEQQDFDDIEKVWPLVLTPDELPRYDIKYLGREQVDELGTYVFDVTPKKLEKNQRYFLGRIWVEDRDMQIVKTRGKGTGLMKKKQDSAYPMFETFRENIEGHFWFPTYTRADDILRFRTGPEVRIRVSVRYSNYKRFGSTIKIGKATQVDPEKPQ